MDQLSDTFFVKNNVYTFLLSALLTLSLISCDSGDENSVGPDPNAPSITERLQDDGELSMLAQLIEQNNLEVDLQGEGSFTVFAPTDSVLESRNLGDLSDEELKSLLSYHIVPADLSAEKIADTETSVQTLQEDSIFISDRTNRTKINNTAHIKASQKAGNGTVHKIDELLFPDTDSNVYEIAYKRYYTHKFACSCTSGRTGLESVLKNTNNEYTVFVPSDQAFKQRAEEFGSVDDLSDEELREILEYHIIEEELLSTDLSEGDVLSTMNGAEITITSVSEDGTIILNDGEATVQTADLQGVNGVVHIIDTVMELPS